MLRFHVVDSLTGRIVGRLEPHDYTFEDPWTGAGTGSLALALPAPEQVPALVDLTRPLVRWVAVEDDAGRFLWAGPITARPGRSGGEVVIPLADWRAWFYAAPLRPDSTGARGDIIVTDTEQATIARSVALAALGTKGAPAMVVDGFPATGVKRERKMLQLDRSCGDYLDGLSARETSDGIEWWVYVLRDSSDPTRLVPHVGFAYPERQTRQTPIRLEWRLGKGGNIAEPSWPTGTVRPTRVWAVGEGEPPDVAWASDEDLDIDDGVQVAWESVIGPLDGVKRNQRCQEYASAALDYYSGQAGQFECDVLDAAIPLGEYGTGDRARLVYDDGWDSVDLAAVRITKRAISGGRGKATLARLTLDLANDGYGDTGTAPGEEVSDDGAA